MTDETDETALERRYRRLLSLYPRRFRREHGEELLSVLMTCARAGQRRPGLSGSADLIKSGLSMRLCPGIPRSPITVRAAVWLMYAGGGVTILSLIGALVALPFIGHTAATLQVAGRTQSLAVTTTVGALIALAMVALWVWMALCNSRGRSWARIFSTVLVALETLHLFGNTGGWLDVAFVAVTWLIGVAAVWLLWRPTSSRYFAIQNGVQAIDDHAQL